MTIKRRKTYTSDYLTWRLQHDTTMTDRQRQSVMKHRLAVLRAEQYWDEKEQAERLARLQRLNNTQNEVK